jgi:hypothetical protein
MVPAGAASGPDSLGGVGWPLGHVFSSAQHARGRLEARAWADELGRRVRADKEARRALEHALFSHDQQQKQQKQQQPRRQQLEAEGGQLVAYCPPTAAGAAGSPGREIALVPLAGVRLASDSKFLKDNHASAYSRKAIEASDLTYRPYEGPDSEDELETAGNGEDGAPRQGRYFNGKLRHHFPVALRSFLQAYKTTVQPKLASLGLEGAPDGE